MQPTLKIFCLILAALALFVVVVVTLLSRNRAVDQVFQADSEEQNLNY